MAYKAENCHALLHEKLFSTHRFLDICTWVFDITYVAFRTR